MGSASGRTRLASLAASLLLALVFLWPTLRLPYLGDDVFNANVDGWMGYQGLSLGAGFARFFVATNTEAGRFYPLWSLLTFGEFHFIHGVMALKCVVVAGILLNALTFYVVLRAIAPAVAPPALAVLPLTWQLRLFQDPILQSSLHMQLALEFVLLGAFFAVRYVRDPKPPALWATFASYACACLTYEPMYALAPAFAALIWTLPPRATRAKVTATIAFALPPLALAATTFAIRLAHPVPVLNAHDLNPALQPFARTFAISALGALPLTYFLFDPGHLFASPQFWLQSLTSSAEWFVLCLAFAATFLAYPRTERGARPWPALAFCAAIWLLSGTLIALSPRWQSELVPGLAYATGYLADFAMAGILGSLTLLLAGALPTRVARSAVALCVALATLTTFAANGVATARYAPYWNMTIPYALEAGLLGRAPEDATVYLDDSYPAAARFTDDTWHAKYFLYRRTGRRFEARPLSELRAGARGAYVLRGAASGFESGIAVAGAVVAVAPGFEGAPLALVDRATIYRRSGRMPPRLAQWSSSCGAVPLDNVLEAMPTATTLTYGPGFFEREGDSASTWRWTSRSSYVAAFNPTDVVRRVRLSFSVRPVRESTIAVMGGGVRRSLRTATDFPVSATLLVPPHSSARVNVSSDGLPQTHPPDPRPVLFEIRDASLDEAACRGRSAAGRR